jgi:nucleoside-diphosphate-sugar epimerase
MIEQLNKHPKNPSRVVVLGASGFVGSSVADKLEAEAIATLRLGRSEVDLLQENAAKSLANYIQPEDSLVIVSAMAPVKNNSMLAYNITMMKNICDALELSRVSHVIYISSDAVYADQVGPLTEASSAEPGSLHGIMHLAREVMLKNVVSVPLAILRPTLIYGVKDPHNGYGPNRFCRLAAAGEEIILFGEGEEQRDHIFVDDVAELVCLMLKYKSCGILNAASGRVVSFRQIAELIVSQFEPSLPIMFSPRNGEMPHNGYRPFDVQAIGSAFPDFSITSLEEGLIGDYNLSVRND